MLQIIAIYLSHYCRIILSIYSIDDQLFYRIRTRIGDILILFEWQAHNVCNWGVMNAKWKQEGKSTGSSLWLIGIISDHFLLPKNQSIPDYDDIRPSMKDDAHCLNMCSYLDLKHVVASQDSFLFFLSFCIIVCLTKTLDFSLVCFSKWRYLGQYVSN